MEASVHGNNVHCTDKTIEAAEALLHMESPTCLRDARSPGMSAAVFVLSAIFPSTNELSKLGNLLLWAAVCSVEHLLAYLKITECLSFYVVCPPGYRPDYLSEGGC